MMELNKIVCSLKKAAKLKELGVKQESYFYYHKKGDNWLIDHFERDWEENISAFTAQEILSTLSAHIRIGKDIGTDIFVYFQPENGTDNSYGFRGDNLADLLAQTLIAQINEGEFKND